MRLPSLTLRILIQSTICLVRIAALAYIPDLGVGTASSSSSMIESLVIPYDSAWKFVSTRWRSTGCDSARMSSKLT
jgi:hypothetical protein